MKHDQITQNESSKSNKEDFPQENTLLFQELSIEDVAHVAGGYWGLHTRQATIPVNNLASAPENTYRSYRNIIFEPSAIQASLPLPHSQTQQQSQDIYSSSHELTANRLDFALLT